MSNYRSRKDHREAILSLLRMKGQQRLRQIIAHLKADDAHRAVEYDLKCLRRDGRIVTEGGMWKIVRKRHGFSRASRSVQ